MAAAYDDLSPAMQALLEPLHASHTPALAAATVKDLNLYKDDIIKTMPPPSVPGLSVTCSRMVQSAPMTRVEGSP